jgi:hypothetical protein
MANIKFSDLAINPDTLLETPASGDYVLIYDVSEPLDINKIKVIAYGDLVNLAAQSALQALVSGQAAGDMLYADTAASLARLAKGTAGQVLRMNSGATAPEWGNNSGLSCYGSFYEASETISATSWADVPNATTDITVPSTSVLIALAVMNAVCYDGNLYVRWVLDGTNQNYIKFEGEGSSLDRGLSIIGVKASVSSGVKTCKLQAYGSNLIATDRLDQINAFILGFAE